jgi:hypothetical protein
MKSLLCFLAVFCLPAFSATVFAQSYFTSSPSPHSNSVYRTKNQSSQALRPGDASFKKSDKKSAINVIFIDYNPTKTGSLKVDVYDSENVLLASQKESVKELNGVSTACIYVDSSADIQSVTAVLNGAGFKNKKLSYGTAVNR